MGRAFNLKLGYPDLLKKIADFINDTLRINAIRRMLTIVTVKKREIFGLVAFAVVFAIFEGVGLSLLLPILQYAEGAAESPTGGKTAILSSSGPFWTALAEIAEVPSSSGNAARAAGPCVCSHTPAPGRVLSQHVVLRGGSGQDRSADEGADA